MKKSYIIFWLSIALAIIAVLIGGVLYLKHELKPLQSVTQKATQIAKIGDVVHKAITQPDKLTSTDAETIANSIINIINPAISKISITKDSTQKVPNKMIFVGINKPLDNRYFYTEVNYLQQVRKSNFYVSTGIEVPIRKDSILNGSKIKLGLTWRRR